MLQTCSTRQTLGSKVDGNCAVVVRLINVGLSLDTYYLMNSRLLRVFVYAFACIFVSLYVCVYGNMHVCVYVRVKSNQGARNRGRWKV
jgi:hypothetical protein